MSRENVLQFNKKPLQKSLQHVSLISSCIFGNLKNSIRDTFYKYFQCNLGKNTFVQVFRILFHCAVVKIQFFLWKDVYFHILFLKRLELILKFQTQIYFYVIYLYFDHLYDTECLVQWHSIKAKFVACKKFVGENKRRTKFLSNLK